MEALLADNVYTEQKKRYITLKKEAIAVSLRCLRMGVFMLFLLIHVLN